MTPPNALRELRELLEAHPDVVITITLPRPGVVSLLFVTPTRRSLVELQQKRPETDHPFALSAALVRGREELESDEA